jgi:hypothetical protein
MPIASQATSVTSSYSPISSQVLSQRLDVFLVVKKSNEGLDVVDEAGIEILVRREEHEQHVCRLLLAEGRASEIGEEVVSHGAVIFRVALQARDELLVGREGGVLFFGFTYNGRKGRGGIPRDSVRKEVPCMKDINCSRDAIIPRH